MWNDFAILANESDDTFSEREIKTIEKSENLFCSLDNSFSSMEKFGHAPRSWIIEIKSLQSVSKAWHADTCNMHSIANEKASSSEWGVRSFCVGFLFPKVELLF